MIVLQKLNTDAISLKPLAGLISLHRNRCEPNSVLLQPELKVTAVGLFLFIQYIRVKRRGGRAVKKNLEFIG